MRHGWGWYLIDCASSDGPIVEVPHPISDRGSEHLGFDIFERAHAGALLVAGSKRDADGAASDVAHAPTSVFSTVHEALLKPARPVVQVHGFAVENHTDLDQQSVVSSGSLDPGTARLADRVTEALRAAGVSVCEFGAHHRCSDLGATRNVQGMSAKDAGSQFVHLEFNEELRAGDDDVIVAALADALSR
jgi:hypothetical protein